jgi:excisionase family DNA binding protein
MPSDELLTVAEIAELFKINQQTVRNWIDRGELPCVRVGRRVRIRWEDIEKFMEPAGPAMPGVRPLDPQRRGKRSGTRVEAGGCGCRRAFYVTLCEVLVFFVLPAAFFPVTVQV